MHLVLTSLDELGLELSWMMRDSPPDTLHDSSSSSNQGNTGKSSCTIIVICPARSLYPLGRTPERSHHDRCSLAATDIHRQRQTRQRPRRGRARIACAATYKEGLRYVRTEGLQCWRRSRRYARGLHFLPGPLGRRAGRPICAAQEASVQRISVGSCIERALASYWS